MVLFILILIISYKIIDLFITFFYLVLYYFS